VTLSNVTLLIVPPVMVTLLDFRFASISEPLLMPLIALESVEKSLSKYANGIAVVALANVCGIVTGSAI
jgi:uncharacterized membrane protein